jgi:dTDP-glucose 4,6-dehydratase
MASLLVTGGAGFTGANFVHFAAESHVDRSIDGPDDFVRTNIVGTHVLLKCARRAWQANGVCRADARFHHVSTDEAYGSLTTSDPACTEQSLYRPSSLYAASKAASDHLVRAYCHTYGLPVTISNCSNNLGPYRFPERLTPLMLVRALGGEPMPVYGRGENLRERYPRCPASRGEKVESLILFVPDRAGHDWRYALDTTRIEHELGFRPEESFASGWRTPSPGIRKTSPGGGP